MFFGAGGIFLNTMTVKASLTREFESARMRLNDLYRNNHWSELSNSLESLARQGENHGLVELASRAHSIRELVGERWGGCQTGSDRMRELVQDLISYLSELQWQHAQPPKPGQEH